MIEKRYSNHRFEPCTSFKDSESSKIACECPNSDLSTSSIVGTVVQEKAVALAHGDSFNKQLL